MNKASKTLSPVPAVSLLLSVRDTCAALGMGRSWLYQQIQAGRIRSVKIGSRTLIPLAEVERFVAEAMADAA